MIIYDWRMPTRADGKEREKMKKRKLRLWVRILLDCIEVIIVTIVLLSPIVYVIFFGYPF